MSGHSLWLVPPRNERLFPDLQRLITDVAAVHRTSVFIPHVTLLADIEGEEYSVRDTFIRYQSGIGPLEVTLGELESKKAPYQILFSQVGNTPALIHANVNVRAGFNRYGEDYFPHLSLAYGDLSPEQVTELKRFVRERYPEVPALRKT